MAYQHYTPETGGPLFIDDKELGYVTYSDSEGGRSPVSVILGLVGSSRIRHPDYVHLPAGWTDETVAELIERTDSPDDVSIDLITGADVAELGREIGTANDHGYVQPPLDSVELAAVKRVRDATGLLRHQWFRTADNRAIPYDSSTQAGQPMPGGHTNLLP